MFCSRCGTAEDSFGRCPRCDASAHAGTSAPVVADALVTGADALVTSDEDLTRDSSASGALPFNSATLRPGQRFGARYTIIRSLGSGGMGDVYQAWDESLGMAVALKTIKADPAAPPGTAHDLEERFKRELRLARQVSHPNVVRIHDLGELGAVKYLTMAYVQGENLATVLGTEGKLPVPRALAIGRQIAAGLAAAHEAGVVHRDLKPANVLIDQDQRALLTDFGIARGVDGGTVHTRAGAVVGTLAYMAPEQARGDVADQRSDVYGFGLILYELLAGGRPRVGGQSDLADLMARVTQGPIPLRQAAPGTPDPLVQLVDRCLKRDPDQRFQDARDLLAALNQLRPDGTLAPPEARRSRWKLAAAVVAVVGAIIAGTWWLAVRNRVPPPITARAPLSVLIADFENKAGDSVFDGSLEQALGIAVEGASFITSFSRKTAADRARELRPGSRLDVAAAQLVAVSEGIGVILGGSIRRDGAGYLLEVRALDPAGGDAIATVSEAAPDKGAVLAAVGRLAQQVRAALGDTTPSAALQAETYSTSSLEAVHEYSIAQSLSVDGRSEEAIRHYRAAVERDPRFGRAYAGWAASTYDLGRRTEAEELWKKALSLMDRMTDREKYRTLGAYFMNVARNYDKAIENYRQLVAQYPADLAGRNNLALAYFYTLDFPRALEEGRRAIDIYPKTPKFRANYALYAMYAGDFATAVESAEQVLRTDPAVRRRLPAPRDGRSCRWGCRRRACGVRPREDGRRHRSVARQHGRCRSGALSGPPGGCGIDPRVGHSPGREEREQLRRGVEVAGLGGDAHRARSARRGGRRRGTRPRARDERVRGGAGRKGIRRGKPRRSRRRARRRSPTPGTAAPARLRARDFRRAGTPPRPRLAGDRRLLGQHQDGRHLAGTVWPRGGVRRGGTICRGPIGSRAVSEAAR